MIQPPNYKKNAVPSPRGWRHPRTGELLKKVRLSEQEINEYLLAQGSISAPEPEVVEIEEEELEYVFGDTTFNDVTVEELEAEDEEIMSKEEESN